jgi:HK97 family phage major capsid protein
MSLIKARQLREQRKKLTVDAQALLAGDTITAEQRTQFDAIMVDAEVLKGDIDRLESLTEPELRTAPPNGRTAGPNFGEMKPEERTKLAFNEYLKRGESRMNPELRDIMTGANLSIDDRGEFRDMGTGGGNALQGTGGGYFVPVGMVNDVENALKFFGSMLTTSTIMDTATGQPLPYPTSNDTTVAGERIAEGTTVTEQDVTLGNVTFNAYMYSTRMVKVSRQLLQDSAFDIQAFLTAKFAERIGRVVNTDMTVGLGSGSSAPNGIITAATSSGITAAGSAANSGGAETGATTLGSDDLLGLEHSVDVLYRQGAQYMMNDLTLKAIKQVKDKYGRPLWMPGLATKEPDTINGYGYAVNNDMVAIATGVKSVLFGQLKKYLIRRVKELSILRLEERYAEFGQVAFIGFARYDGNLLDAGTHPVKYITQA